MALWNSGVTWSAGVLWGPSSPAAALPYANTRRQLKLMKRNDYYPRRVAERPEWHANLAAKLPIHGPTLGLSATQIDNAVADNLLLAYGYGDWKTNLYEVGPAGTASLELLASGTGGDPFVFPTYTAPTPPTLPAGITGVLPGALDRTFLLVQEMKAKPDFTLPIGLDMGIVGSEAPAPPPGETSAPRIKVRVIQGTECQAAEMKFFKDGHTGIYSEVRINGGAWQFLTASDTSPILDDRPLQVPGQAEVREYRARFWDGGKPNGPWCDVVRVTIGP